MFPSSSKNWSRQQLKDRLESLSQEEMKSYYLHKEGLDDKNVLPVEVLNRINEFIPYSPLTSEAAVEITKRIASDLREHYENEYAIDFETDDDVLRDFALADFNGAVDGRAIKNKLEKVYSNALHAAAEKLGLKANESLKLKVGVDAHGHQTLQVWMQNQMLTLAPLGLKKPNPTDDPIQAQRLLNMEAELNKEVIGQEDAMHEIAAGVMGHGEGNEQALIVYLGGISGNGKTETGRALAKARYGSDTRLAIIPLGNIQDQHQFDNIFGISAQLQGGSAERLFEKALRENPDGGVIIFDEISNLGGMDRNMKTSLLMKFYDIFEQGRYISPIDGREYSLGKYTMVLTGNDGEENFRGMTDDDLLLDTWNRNKSPEQVRRMLTSRGWPLALVNRVAIKILLKPILSSEIGPIAKKLLDRELKDFHENNKNVMVNVPQDFSTKLAKAFFSPDQGARGLRDVLKTKIRGALTNSLLKMKATQTSPGPITLNLELKDTKRTKPYVHSFTPNRNITLEITSSQEGQTSQVAFEDLTAQGNAEILLSRKNATLVGYHEAGHAVLGKDTAFITIRGGRSGDVEYHGYARENQSKKEYLNMDRHQFILRIATLWAGRKAQELAGFTADSGWNQDLAQIREALTFFFLKSGLDREFVGVAVNDKGEPQLSPAKAEILEQKMAAMEAEGEQLAEKVLVEKWTFVRAIVAELLKKGQVDGSKLKEIELSAEKAPYRRPFNLGLRCERLFN